MSDFDPTVGPHEPECPAVPMTKQDGSTVYMGMCVCEDVIRPAQAREREACVRRYQEAQAANRHCEIAPDEIIAAIRGEVPR